MTPADCQLIEPSEPKTGRNSMCSAKQDYSIDSVQGSSRPASVYVYFWTAVFALSFAVSDVSQVQRIDSIASYVRTRIAVPAMPLPANTNVRHTRQ